MKGEPEATRIVEFVNLALSQHERRGIGEMLGWIAQATHSSGATLWECDPDIPTSDPGARLFTAGHWFRSGKHFAAHDLSLQRSLAGEAIRTQRTETAQDVRNDTRAADSPIAKQFFAHHGILRCQTRALGFTDRGTGAIALYRSAEDPPFPESGEPVLLHACQLVPGLRESLLNKVGFTLIENVKDLLRAELNPAEPTQPWASVCERIQDCFQLIEASVFLEDPVRHPGLFRLYATTSEAYAANKEYSANQDGLTSWVITNRKPVRVWDLQYYHRKTEKALIEAQHPGIVWRDPIKAKETTAKILNVPISEIPPLNFLAEPIMSGTRLCGVLRCCTANIAPYYLADRERGLLAVVASQLGQYWTEWLERRLVRDENKAWSALVSSISALNNNVNAELRGQRPDVLNVFNRGLEATKTLIPGGEIIDIRLMDEKSDELYFALTPGQEWTEARKACRFPASRKPPQSAGAWVFQNAKLRVMADVSNDKYYKEVFPETKSMMIVPIQSADRVYGVVDIRNTGSSQFATYAQQMAELLGQQLGLYYELIRTVGELEDQTRIAQQAYADWQHQIRGPISQAYIRLRDVIRLEFRQYEDTPQYLKVQRGLLGKARRAAGSLRLFLELATGPMQKLDLQRIEGAELNKLLVETCLDNRVLASQRKGVDFNVKTESFAALGARELRADIDLLEQAVNNVIDNAFKYSYRGTRIDLSGFFQGPFFGITVSNVGVPITESDLPNIGKRGWRSEKAGSVVGEGTGIGLWVVNHIMEAHEGRLQVLPTSAHGRTDVHLLFPYK